MSVVELVRGTSCFTIIIIFETSAIITVLNSLLTVLGFQIVYHGRLYIKLFLLLQGLLMLYAKETYKSTSEINFMIIVSKV